MTFNYDKCKHLLITTRTLQTVGNFRLGNERIANAEKESDLGVTVSCSGKRQDQCVKAANKANSVLGMIKRTVKSRSRAVMLPLFKSLVRPHLEYCGPAWRPYLRKDVEKVEKIQRRFTKMIRGTEGLSYEERLQSLGMITMEMRFHRNDLIMVYKILNGKIDVDPGIFFKLSENRQLRGHPWKLEKTRVNMSRTSHSFSKRIVNDWNALPENVVLAPSIETFKERLHRTQLLNPGVMA